jgi:hypothetical protein
MAAQEAFVSSSRTARRQSSRRSARNNLEVIEFPNVFLFFRPMQARRTGGHDRPAR